MKFPIYVLATLSFALGAALAHADVKVNDEVIYQVSLAGLKGTSSLRLTQYDPSKNEYLQHSEVNMGAGEVFTQSSDNWMPASSFPTDAKIKDLIAQCGKKGGKLETVQVPAGKFKACTLPDSQSCPGMNCVASFAEVPFGIARLTYNTNSGVPVTLELQGFGNDE